jgi:hypothetical protein
MKISNKELLEYLIFRKTGNRVKVWFERKHNRGWLVQGKNGYPQRLGYNLLDAHCLIVESSCLEDFTKGKYYTAINADVK